MPSLQCLFIVQGEGRGHMTQALALRSMLAEAGHEVPAVLVGRSAIRALPAFFMRKIDAPITQFDSPNFALDARNKSIRLGPTIRKNVRNVARYRASLRLLDDQVRSIRPDVIVNFFEPLAGIYNYFYRPEAPFVCIGHQYMFHHPAYPFPSGHLIQRTTLQRFTQLTSLRATRKLALSFYEAPDRPDQRIVVMPPLLRKELFKQPDDVTEPFFLIYVLNSGYADEIARWHGEHPDVVLHCFWDNRSVPEVHTPQPNLTFHQLDDEKFLNMMARCTGLVCTAGFESTCEAMYLGKPVLAVPVEGHFEQYCNARDAVASGAGIFARQFDLTRLIDFLPDYESRAPAMRRWMQDVAARYVAAIEEVVRMPEAVG